MAITFHGYVNTMNCACMNVDSYNCAGVYASGDLDNGVFVTLGDINKDSAGKIQGFEYIVTPATSATTGKVWLVATPEVGTTIEQQIYNDPRAFYNEAGKPMSLKYLVPGVDCIEVTKECFTGNALPDGTTNKFATIGAGGKLVAAAADPGSGKIYFELVGFHSITFGGKDEKTAVLRIARN